MSQNASGLILLGGPTGAGKTSLISALTSMYPERFSRVRSFTTRSPRPDENTSEYTFVDESTIARMFADGELLNLDLAYGHYYGMSRSSVEEIIASDKFAVKEVHPANHAKLRTAYPDLLSILIRQESTLSGSTSSWDSERQSRLEMDTLFYQDIDLSTFDIIRTISPDESAEDVAAHLTTTIVAVHAGQSRFPRASEIDALNTEGYSRAAKEFVDSRRITTLAFHQLSFPFFQEMLRRIPPNTRCLEVGPGSNWLRQSFGWPPVEYVGIELAGGMLEAHHLPTQQRKVGLGSVRAMPFPSSYFDFVLGSLADPFCYPAALCEIWRVIKPEAAFAFSAPAAEWAEALRSPEMRDRTTFLLDDDNAADVFSFAFDEQELRSLLERCGFEILEFHRIPVAELPTNHNVPPAFQIAADRLGIPHSNLIALNCVLARKRRIVT